jgi:regulator of replication initiation timing
MSSVAEQLDSVLHKASRLIELCNALQEENELLKQENDAVKLALNASKIKNSDLDEKMRVLKLAKSIEGTSEKTLDIKQKINDFVREIDKCVVLLKK